MLNDLGSSSPIVGFQTQENQIIADFEGMLSNGAADRLQNDRGIDQSDSGWMLRRLVPIVLLAGVGAALALVPMGLKSGVMTGRSVAHAPQDR